MQSILTNSTPMRRPRALLLLLATIAFMAGCATSPSPKTTQRQPTGPELSTPSGATPVIRYGRYTLVEIIPTNEQRDLMEQIVDITIPGAATASVGDALRYSLLRSGYQLCDDRDDIRAFDTLPLPASHMHIGPMVLRDALQMLVGRTWELQVNEAGRRVCFASRVSATQERKP